MRTYHLFNVNFEKTADAPKGAKHNSVSWKSGYATMTLTGYHGAEKAEMPSKIGQSYGMFSEGELEFAGKFEKWGETFYLYFKTDAAGLTPSYFAVTGMEFEKIKESFQAEKNAFWQKRLGA